MISCTIQVLVWEVVPWYRIGNQSPFLHLFEKTSVIHAETEVGGGKDGGIMVREGCSLKSPEHLA